MENEKGHNKKKREEKKTQRLRRLSGLDLCACGGGDRLRCKDKCREKHTSKTTGQVMCGELYHVESPPDKSGGKKRSKRTWRYGRQKDIDANQQSKQKRREKIERECQ
jgi:hypothetical protein